MVSIPLRPLSCKFESIVSRRMCLEGIEPPTSRVMSTHCRRRALNALNPHSGFEPCPRLKVRYRNHLGRRFGSIEALPRHLICERGTTYYVSKRMNEGIPPQYPIFWMRQHMWEAHGENGRFSSLASLLRMAWFQDTRPRERNPHKRGEKFPPSRP